LNDPDEYADAVSGIELKVDFQRRQSRPAAVEQFQTPDWALDFGEAHVKTAVRGVLPGGWASMCFVRGPANSTWNGLAGEPGTLCCVPPGEELDGQTSPGFVWMTVALPLPAWAQCRAVAGLDDRAFHRYSACPLTPAVSSRIEHRIREVHRRLRAPFCDADAADLARRAAADLASSLATMACEISGKLPPTRDSLRNRTRLARRAEDWMRAHLADAVQIPDVCLALGVSRRELEYAFRTTFDQSPRDFLHILRLHAIRRALLRAEERPPILHTALDHGITHPSRFAADYHALFGERPSETLRR
jgi:AraC-like DNA-binding protein